MKTTHIAAICLGIVCGIVLFFMVPSVQKSFTAPRALISTSPTPQKAPTAQPTEIPKEEYFPPVRVRIPSLNFDAEVEHVGNDEKGRMDVPQKIENTAWYKPGYIPGTKGSAVIAAHYDTPTGAPGPFYNIGSLKPGDSIETEDEQGTILKFKVEETQTHKDAAFPIQEVFARKDKPRLNLITCGGTWDKNTQNYSDRLVVYAVLE